MCSLLQTSSPDALMQRILCMEDRNIPFNVKNKSYEFWERKGKRKRASFIVPSRRIVSATLLLASDTVLCASVSTDMKLS
jgi:hypothetical protein